MSGSGYVWPGRSILVSLLVSLLAISACSEVQFISEYDQATDQQVSALQRDVEVFFTTMERNPTQPQCNHASHDAFYQQATVDINLLIARNEIRTKNDITNKQLAILKKSLEDLEELHKLADEENRCLNEVDLMALRTGFGVSFRGILQLELSKRRPETPGDAN